MGLSTMVGGIVMDALVEVRHDGCFGGITTQRTRRPGQTMLEECKALNLVVLISSPMPYGVMMDACV